MKAYNIILTTLYTLSKIMGNKRLNVINGVKNKNFNFFNNQLRKMSNTILNGIKKFYLC